MNVGLLKTTFHGKRFWFFVLPEIGSKPQNSASSSDGLLWCKTWWADWKMWSFPTSFSYPGENTLLVVCCWQYTHISKKVQRNNDQKARENSKRYVSYNQASYKSHKRRACSLDSDCGGESGNYVQKICPTWTEPELDFCVSKMSLLMYPSSKYRPRQSRDPIKKKNWLIHALIRLKKHNPCSAMSLKKKMFELQRHCKEILICVTTFLCMF